MKYRMSSWYYKLLAWIMAAVCLVFGFWAAYITMSCASLGIYEEDNSYQQTLICRDRMRSVGREIMNQYRRDPEFKDWDALLQNTDLRFILLEEESGKVVASCVTGLGIRVPGNLKNNVYLKENNYIPELGLPGSIFETVYVIDHYFNSTWSGDHSFTYMYEGVAIEAVPDAQDTTQTDTMYQILYLLPRGLSANKSDIITRGFEIYRVWNSWKEEAPVALAFCAVGFLVAIIFLGVQAGRRPGKEALVSTWVDRIWLEIVLAAGVMAACGAALLFIALYETYYNYSLTWPELQLLIVLCDAGAVACGLAVLGCLLTIITRLKTKRFLRSMLIWRVLSWVWKWVKKPVGYVADTMRRGFLSLGMVPLAVLSILGVLIVELLLFIWLVNSYEPAGPVAILILFNVFVVLAVVWGLAQMKKLQQAAKALAEGDLEHHLDTNGMYWHFKAHGEDLNAIAGGMNKAVEQRMRSENLKTELITNVSHDIKTPLTSIINYVDLLQKPHTEAEGIQYLEVLQRQSRRLKKLTEDLVEASKASTGNIPVELEQLQVLELLNQAVEEYRERLELGNLEIVTNIQGDLKVLADGKLLWRVLDNLLGNVVKYALAGTRVYVTAAKQADQVRIAIKNISRDSLEADALDLTERFVRGDASRHTEGSGLGLNIAQSLVRLQNGVFTLTVDGDLFKAEIALPAV